MTQYGYICMVPSHAEVEDCILAFAGGSVLYVVRHAGWFPEKSTLVEKYTFVGEAYVHGLMDVDVASVREKSEFILI